MTKKLPADIRHEVVQRFLQQLTEQEPQLYYASTSVIAHRIHDALKARINSLDFEEQQALKHLDARDIEVILSYH